MPDDHRLRIPDRADVLFAISRGLNSRHGHEHAARVAAEIVLATLEAQQFVIMRKPPARDTTPRPPEAL